MSPARVLVVRSGARPFPPVPGVEVVEYVSHEIEPVAPAPAEWSAGWDTVIVTSQIAVERIARDASHADPLRRALEHGTLVAVGEATAQALRRYGLTPDVIAAGSARSMLESLSTSLAGQHVLWPCGEDASLDLARLLEERGARVTRLVLYRKRTVPPDPGLSSEILERRPVAFCATSPAAADWIFAGLSCDAAERLRAIPAVALGPSTLERLADLGVERVEVAEEARFASAGKLLARLASEGSGT
jgi:uroporphyrinogen III methyltransferase / synthase